MQTPVVQSVQDGPGGPGKPPPGAPPPSVVPPPAPGSPTGLPSGPPLGTPLPGGPHGPLSAPPGMPPPGHLPPPPVGVKGVRLPTPLTRPYQFSQHRTFPTSSASHNMHMHNSCRRISTTVSNYTKPPR